MDVWIFKKYRCSDVDSNCDFSYIPIFAYTKKVEFYTKMWFEKKSWEVSETWAELFVFGGGE